MPPLDPDLCYAASSSRDARFDGWFVIAVRTTGIYCRPSCPAITPKRANVEFHHTAAAAQQRGFRACKRCRPDATPGSPDWNTRHDLVGRAMRLIADGVIERSGVGGLAGALGYSERHLNRLLTEEVGAGPLAIARAQRAQTARILIETTDLRLTDVAFAAGFGSVRQFNDTVQQVFASSPTELRSTAHRRGVAGSGSASPSVTLRLRLDDRSPPSTSSSSSVVEPSTAWRSIRPAMTATPSPPTAACSTSVDDTVSSRSQRAPGWSARTVGPIEGNSPIMSSRRSG